MMCPAASNEVCGYGCFLLCLQGTLSCGAGAWEIQGMALPVQGEQLGVLRGLAAAPGYAPPSCVTFSDVSLSLGFW